MKYLVLREWYGSPKVGQVVEIENISKVLLPNVKKLQETTKPANQPKETKKGK